MKSKIKVSFRVMPFGEMSCELSGHEVTQEEELRELPRYVEPTTTDIESMEIHYIDNDTYVVPQTTAGV